MEGGGDDRAVCVCGRGGGAMTEQCVCGGGGAMTEQGVCVWGGG